MNLPSLIMIVLCLSCTPAQSRTHELAQTHEPAHPYKAVQAYTLENRHFQIPSRIPSKASPQGPLIQAANTDEETRQLAKSYCKQKYAKRYSGIDLKPNGSFRCLYRRTKEEIRAQAVLECKQKHGKMYKNVEMKGRRYWCIFKKTREQLIQEAKRLCRKRYGNRLTGVSFPLANKGTYSRFVCEF